jgi:hypothetical protein
MSSQLITNIQMTTVREDLPTRNYGTLGYAALRDGSGNDAWILVKFGLPGVVNALYGGTKLRIYNSGVAIGSRTYTLQRLTSSFSTTLTTWAKKPTSTSAGQVQVTTAVGAKGAVNDYIEFDISGLLNVVSSGTTKWYGFVIKTAVDVTDRHFYTSKGSVTKGPIVDATWSTAPKAPANMNPSDGRAIAVQKPVFGAEFVDVAGNTTLQALQIQIHSTNNFTGSIDFDSGTVATTDGFYDSSTGAFAGISAGQTKWWRLRYQDGDGNWGPYSAPTSFTRVNKGTVGISAPAVAPNDFVEDNTPTIIWSFSGTQTAVQILIWNDNKTVVVSDTNKITTTDTSMAIEDPLGLINGTWYRLEVRIWDDIPRTNLFAGLTYTAEEGRAYATLERRFLVTLSASVTPATGLALTQIGQLPIVEGTFQRTTVPDFIDVLRDGQVFISNADPADLFVSGTTYKFRDRLATPRIQHQYEARPKVNGQTASGNSTANITPKIISAYLHALDGEFAIPFLKYEENLEYEDGSTTVDIMNSDEAITIYQSASGFRGTFNGVLSKTLPGVLGTETARDHLNNLLKLRQKENLGRLMVLSYKDQAIPCTISKVQYSAVVYREEVCYLASFFAVQKRRVLQ